MGKTKAEPTTTATPAAAKSNRVGKHRGIALERYIRRWAREVHGVRIHHDAMPIVVNIFTWPLEQIVANLKQTGNKTARRKDARYAVADLFGNCKNFQKQVLEAEEKAVQSFVDSKK